MWRNYYNYYNSKQKAKEIAEENDFDLGEFNAIRIDLAKIMVDKQVKSKDLGKAIGLNKTCLY